MIAIAYWVALSLFLVMAILRAPFGRESLQNFADGEDISFGAALTTLALSCMMMTAPLAMGIHLSLRAVLR